MSRCNLVSDTHFLPIHRMKVKSVDEVKKHKLRLEKLLHGDGRSPTTKQDLIDWMEQRLAILRQLVPDTWQVRAQARGRQSRLIWYSSRNTMP